MNENIKGKTWVFGDNIDTDAIIPARYLVTSDPAKLALHCMEDARPDFVKIAKPGDIIIAGDNFGCGSSREHAPVCIKAAGITCVAADSFARIFFRNAVNIGLPVFEAPGIGKNCADGDVIKISPVDRLIRNITNGREFAFEPYPPFLQEIVSAGGLIEWVRNKV
jgi:3-isopropylmalate/(R)-2-methylmalate dehydratase small subunit